MCLEMNAEELEKLKTAVQAGQLAVQAGRLGEAAGTGGDAPAIGGTPMDTSEAAMPGGKVL